MSSQINGYSLFSLTRNSVYLCEGKPPVTGGFSSRSTRYMKCVSMSRSHNVMMIAQGHICSLQWRHNERDDFSNHRRLDCLLSRLFRHRSKKTPKLRVTGLCLKHKVNEIQKGYLTKSLLLSICVCMLLCLCMCLNASYFVWNCQADITIDYPIFD